MPQLIISNMDRERVSGSLHESIRQFQKRLVNSWDIPFRFDTYTSTIHFGYSGRHPAVKAAPGEISFALKDVLLLLKRGSRTELVKAFVKNFSARQPFSVSVEMNEGTAYHIFAKPDDKGSRYVYGQLRDITLSHDVAGRLMEKEQESDIGAPVQVVLEDNSSYNRQLLESIMDNASEGFVVLSCVRDKNKEIVDFKYDLVNKAAQYLLGVPADKLKGQKLLEVFPGTVEMGIFELYMKVMQTGRSSKREFYYTSEGFDNWFRQTVAPFQDGLLVTTTDITAIRRAEQEARAKEEKLKRAQALARIGSFEMNVPKNTIWCSDELYTIFGLEQQAETRLSEKTLLNTISEENQAKVLEAFDNLKKKPQVISLELTIRNIKGRKLFVSAEAESVAGLDGKVEFITGYIQDITEKTRAGKLLQQTTDLLLETQDIAKVGSFSWDVGSGQIQWTPQLYRMWGYPENSPVDLSKLEEKVIPADRGRLHNALSGLTREDPDFEVEFRLRPAGNETLDVWCKGRALYGPNGNVRSYVGKIADISTLKNVERELLQKNIELERTNSELEQFANAASHSLKEPLRMISIYTGLLRDKYQSQLDKEAREYIRIAQESSRRVADLMDELIVFSNIGREETAPVRVDLNVALKEAVHLVGDEFRKRGAKLALKESLPVLHAPYRHVLKVFLSLLENALKFNKSNTPQIRVEAQREEDFWHISVADNGIGIREEYHEKIFLLYHTLHPSGIFKGRGAGLAICRKIVQHHGGRIWVESREGEGATFHFTLPAV